MSTKDYALSVVAGKIAEGAQLHMWKHRLDDAGQWWMVNYDNSISPEQHRDLVIGW